MVNSSRVIDLDIDKNKANNWGQTLLDGYSDDDLSYDSNVMDDDDADNDDDDDLTQRSTRTLSNVKDDVKRMNLFRASFILAIITMAVISSECVFIIATLNESANFQDAYTLASNSIIDNFYEQSSHAIIAGRGLAAAISSSYDTAPWPNVTITNFPSLCENAYELAHSSSIVFQPMIHTDSRAEWESYASLYYPLTLQRDGFDTHQPDPAVNFFENQRSWDDGIYAVHNGTAFDADTKSKLMFPVWQMYPIAKQGNQTGLVGSFFDEYSNSVRANALQSMMYRNGSAISSFLFQNTNNSDVAYMKEPRSNLLSPIFHNTRSVLKDVSGVINSQINWDGILQGATLNYNETMIIVLQSSCGGNFSYKVKGSLASYFGPGQLQNASVNNNLEILSSSYDHFSSLFDGHGMIPYGLNSSCSYRVTVYASKAFRDVFFTSKPNIYRATVFGVLIMLSGLFVIFDRIVGKHQQKMVEATKQSDAIVRSLFPDKVVDRLYEEANKKKDMEKYQNSALESKNRALRNFMKSPTMASESHDSVDTIMETEPIAELFPNTTILFADFVGFTAWCSEREPVQVFTLLETVFYAMDKIARRMHVFKVETIGDCYVAATGIPEPQKDHAERMALFAFRCLNKVRALTKRLESQLGPGTSDLSMRMGIHSGPITAGVVRGQKARFQLFGDTMNMASRIESSGMKNKIHVSKDTAALLKPHMVMKREDVVTLKGKGAQETYWLQLQSVRSDGSRSSGDDSYFNSSTSSRGDRIFMDLPLLEGSTLIKILGKSKIDPHTERLIAWNVDILKPMLSSLVARRDLDQPTQFSPNEDMDLTHEVQVIIEMDKFDARAHAAASVNELMISDDVENELQSYVAAIASGYPNNPFHSFEHCSHVVMSASKLMRRIVASEEIKEQSSEAITLKHLHEHTFGIATDPLCQFAIVFAALVHDVGHPGVPNQRLAVEDPELAEKYNNRSIAEQRSLDVAFELLKLPSFDNLRKCIYTTQEECTRFRQLVVNSILATDIADKEMKALRDNRWNAAFTMKSSDSKLDDWMNRKATIVIEHIIQASDVAHTMQHFVIYQKWNERLYQELYFAFLAGRIEKDPTLGWYNGEIWFFDNYIIPLAKKLEECGVFGVSSDEYLHYAQQNRDEWERKGHEIVEGMRKRADAAKSLELLRGKRKNPKSSKSSDSKVSTSSFSEQHL